MAAIRIGISSWTEPTLIKQGSFYPKGVTSAEGRLKFYASQFPIVEVDSTYYGPPSERNARLWVERTPREFIFNIKAYSLLTHHAAKPDSLYPDLRDALPPKLRQSRSIYVDQLPPPIVDELWQRFQTALAPLHVAGKLGACLFQFPQWFVVGRAARDYIVECKRRLPDYRLAIEFRHKSWLDETNCDETLAFLAEHDLPFVCVDEPQGFDSSLPPLPAVTSKRLSMVRFHGRNTATWNKKTRTAAERFNYLYSEQELAGWLDGIRAMARQSEETHVIMNNCYSDYAVQNARDVARLLGEPLGRESVESTSAGRSQRSLF